MSTVEQAQEYVTHFEGPWVIVESLGDFLVERPGRELESFERIWDSGTGA